MPKLQNFISRLQKVKQTGKDSWIACCPSHNDKSPSMTIRELPDGRILAHCFAECPIDDVMAAVGLTLADLMPDDPTWQKRKPEAIPFNPRDVLTAISADLKYLGIFLSGVAKGEIITFEEKDEALRVAGRLIKAADMGRGE